VGGATYQYDANGNMVVGGGRSVSYNLTNKVEHLVSTDASQVATVDFMYGADGNRVVQMIASNGGDSRTVYVGLGATGKSLYERTSSSAGVEHVNFIYAGDTHSGNAFSIRVLAADGSAKSSKYFSFDHLGSTTLVSDELGRVSGFGDGGNATALGYDAWGARRNTDGTVADPAMLKSAAGRREYTGHEAIADVGLLNMNGRVYDPGIGRFLSADPNVQFVADLQSYNRYSYVQNNPLRYTDPTGYLSWGSDTWVNIAIGVVGVGVCTYTGGSACPLYFAAVGAAFNGYRAYERGADGQQIVTSVAVGIALGGIAGAVGGAASNNPAMRAIIGGAVSGALSAAYGTAQTGGGWGDLGKNVLAGAAIGAATSAAFYELRVAAVSMKQKWAAEEGSTLSPNGGTKGTARLWSRNIDSSKLPWYGRALAWVTGASHAGWAIETPGGTYIVESGCDGCDHLGQGGRGEAYVTRFKDIKQAHQHFQTENRMTISEHGRWSIDIENFDGRAHALKAQFNGMRIPYDWSSTNSNYFAHWFGNQAGIPTNQTVAGSPFQPGHWLAYGWNHPDVVVADRR
jgi:RHS repeat-associated protein